MSRSRASSWSSVNGLCMRLIPWRRAPAPSQYDLQPVLGDFPALAEDLRALRRAINQDRIGVVDVDKDTPRTQPFKGGQRSIVAIDRHVAHAAGSLGTGR